MMENSALSKVMRSFTIMWVLTALGMWLGTMLPKGVALAASVVTMLLLVLVMFVRSVKLMRGVAYTIPVLVGITLVWTTQFYIDELGKNMVLLIFISCVATFIVLGLVGTKIAADLSGMGKYLFGAVLVLIIVSLVFIFVPVSNMTHLIFAAIGLLLFVLYTIYDFNMIKNDPPEDEMVPMVALNLYLDLINMIKFALELVWRIKEEYVD